MLSVHVLASDFSFLQDMDKREFVEADDSDLSDFEVGEAPGINCQAKLFESHLHLLGVSGDGIRTSKIGFVGHKDIVRLHCIHCTPAPLARQLGARNYKMELDIRDNFAERGGLVTQRALTSLLSVFLRTWISWRQVVKRSRKKRKK